MGEWEILPVSQNWGQWRGGAQNGVARFLDVQGPGGGGNHIRDVMKCPSDRRPRSNVGDPPSPPFMPYVWCSGSVEGLDWVWTSYTAGAVFSFYDDKNRYGSMAKISPSTGLFWDGWDSALMDNHVSGPSGYNLHGTGMNMVCADGHVQYMNMAPMARRDKWHHSQWYSGDAGYDSDGVRQLGVPYPVASLTFPYGEPW